MPDLLFHNLGKDNGHACIHQLNKIISGIQLPAKDHKRINRWQNQTSHYQL
mgnify:CR=1 FL=1